MIVTFYSFKGGVGRSMAVANCAELLADAGYRVIVCDWDLEAPGLERYLFDCVEDSEKCRQRDGVIDLLVEYKKSLTGASRSDTSGAPQAGIPDLPRPSSLAFRVDGDRRQTGSIRLLTSGRRDGGSEKSYADKVQSFNWTDFYDRWAGGAYFEFFRTDLESEADIVLIDSRTGVTEYGGVCTHHLADVVVLMAAANDLNVEGAKWMAERLSRPALAGLRGSRPLSILPVAARIEQTAQSEELGLFRDRFKRTFEEYLPAAMYGPHSFFKDAEIPYIPLYSFKERVVAREDKVRGNRDLHDAYKALTETISTVGLAVGLLQPPPSPGWLTPVMDEAIATPGWVSEAQLRSLLGEHQQWLRSEHKEGQRANLASLRLRGRRLQKAELREANLTRVDLTQADLSGADLAGATLVGADLRSSNLEEACLVGANLENADLERANLLGADLSRANLAGAKLSRTNLTRADLSGAHLHDAYFAGVSLKAARLTNVVGLTPAQVKHAILDDATLLPSDVPVPKFRYNAYLAYAQGADADLAERVHAALKDMARASDRRNTLAVFRGANGLSASPDADSAARQTLDDSEFLVLLASRAAARSQTVERELKHWMECRSIDNVLIVLTGGDLAWDDDAKDFDWNRTTALPQWLRNTFSAKPLFIDLRWAAESRAVSLQDTWFRNGVATLAARLLNVPKDNILQAYALRRTVRSWVRRGSLPLGLSLALLVMTIAMTIVRRENANLKGGLGEATSILRAKQTAVDQLEKDLRMVPDKWRVLMRELSWETITPQSWVKPKDLFGGQYYLRIDAGVYLWPLRLFGKEYAEITINTSPTGRDDGTSLYRGNLELGKPVTFKSEDHEYRLNMVKIGWAGMTPTDALFVRVERRSGVQEGKDAAEQKAPQRQDKTEQKSQD